MKVVKHYWGGTASAAAGELTRRHASFIARKASDFPLYRLHGAVLPLPLTYFAPFQIPDFSGQAINRLAGVLFRQHTIKWNFNFIKQPTLNEKIEFSAAHFASQTLLKKGAILPVPSGGRGLL